MALLAETVCLPACLALRLDATAVDLSTPAAVSPSLALLLPLPMAISPILWPATVVVDAERTRVLAGVDDDEAVVPAVEIISFALASICAMRSCDDARMDCAVTFFCGALEEVMSGMIASEVAVGVVGWNCSATGALLPTDLEGKAAAGIDVVLVSPLVTMAVEAARRSPAAAVTFCCCCCRRSAAVSAWTRPRLSSMSLILRARSCICRGGRGGARPETGGGDSLPRVLPNDAF